MVVFSSFPAQADLYHAVEPGDTLNNVARRYHLTPEAIRTANRLNDTRDDAPLPTILLLIPDGGKTDKTSEVPTPSRTLGDASKTGTIVQMMSYVVKAGDALESIRPAA